MKINTFRVNLIVVVSLLLSSYSITMAKQNIIKPKTQKRTKWVLVLGGNVEGVKKAWEEGGSYNLRMFAGDVTLKTLNIRKIEVGSVEITVEGGKSFEEINALYENGNFRGLMGEEIKILAVKAAKKIKEKSQLRPSRVGQAN